jgi:hypothetical protein
MHCANRSFAQLGFSWLARLGGMELPRTPRVKHKKYDFLDSRFSPLEHTSSHHGRYWLRSGYADEGNG